MPGVYASREFPRRLEGLEASGPSGALVLEKTHKNRWRVTTGGSSTITLRYRFYVGEVEHDMVNVSGAATFLSLVESGPRPHDVELLMPGEWRESVTELARHPNGRAHTYRAPDFDALADSDFCLGTPSVHTFEVDGVEYRLANFGDERHWDMPRVLRDTQAVVQQVARFWGGRPPFARYTFMNIIDASITGGNEHAASAIMYADRFTTQGKESYLTWLSMVAHELFHAWNVKALRPVAFVRYDYDHEVPTPSLWVVEGVTSYYHDLFLRRAGLITDDEYLERLSVILMQLETTPGRLFQSTEMASFDTWIRWNRRDDSMANRSIDPYTKGAAVAFLLDARLRKATTDRKSLDDVLRLAVARFAGTGYTSAQFQALCEEVAGTSLADFFTAYVRGAEPLDYSGAREHLGLDFDPAYDGGEDAAYLGVSSKKRTGRWVVQAVRRDSPADLATLQPRDELIAIDGLRIPLAGMDEQLARYKAGQTAEFLVSRRTKLLTLPVTFGRRPPSPTPIMARAEANAAQLAARAAWLAGSPAR